MKEAGYLLLLAGLGALGYGMFMDISYHGVINLSLISHRQSILMMGGIGFVGGIIMLGFGISQEGKKLSNMPTDTSPEGGERYGKNGDISYWPDGRSRDEPER